MRLNGGQGEELAVHGHCGILDPPAQRHAGERSDDANDGPVRQVVARDVEGRIAQRLERADDRALLSHQAADEDVEHQRRHSEKDGGHDLGSRLETLKLVREEPDRRLLLNRGGASDAIGVEFILDELKRAVQRGPGRVVRLADEFVVRALEIA